MGNGMGHGEEETTGWVFMVQKDLDENGSNVNIADVDELGVEHLLLDSGAFMSVCPKEYAAEWGLQALGGHETITLRSAAGEALHVHGKRAVKFPLQDDQGLEMVVWIEFVVCDVLRALIATSELLDLGFGVIKKNEGCYIEKEDKKVPFLRRDGTFVLPVRREIPQTSGDFGHGPGTSGGLEVEWPGEAGEIRASVSEGTARSNGHPLESRPRSDQLAEGLPALKRPSGEAASRHLLTHVPSTAGCEDCVAGRGEEAAHRRLHREASATSVATAGYCYSGLKDEAELERKDGDLDEATVLVIFGAIGCAMATSVPRKGQEPYFVQLASISVKELGYPRTDLQIEGESAIKSWTETVQGEWCEG